MLRKIPDNSARPLLEEVQRLQDSLFLGLVSLPTAHTWANSRALAVWVNQLPDWSSVPDLVENRFVPKNAVWARHAIAIASSETTTKAEMRKVWESHRKAKELYASGSTHALEMPNWKEPPAWQALHSLLASFYDAALGDSVFPLSQGRTISRATYIAGFASLGVCPYWDCSMVSGTTQLDHFLPISHFPFLSICPDNLVPVTHDPNRRGHKGDKIALDGAVSPATHRAATEWFHPRWLNAVGKLEAVVSRAPTKIFSVQVQATAACWRKHVSNFDGLVDLSYHWTEETNTRWRDDLTSLGQTMNDYGPSALQAVQKCLDALAAADSSRPFTLLHKGKFRVMLTDQGILKELEDQAAELKKQGVGAFRGN